MMPKPPDLAVRLDVYDFMLLFGMSVYVVLAHLPGASHVFFSNDSLLLLMFVLFSRRLRVPAMKRPLQFLWASVLALASLASLIVASPSSFWIMVSGVWILGLLAIAWEREFIAHLLGMNAATARHVPEFRSYFLVSALAAVGAALYASYVATTPSGFDKRLVLSVFLVPFGLSVLLIRRVRPGVAAEQLEHARLWRRAMRSPSGVLLVLGGVVASGFLIELPLLMGRLRGLPTHPHTAEWGIVSSVLFLQGLNITRTLAWASASERAVSE